MKVAIVGCGAMGFTHAKNIAKMPGVEFVGAFDVRAEAAEKIASHCGTKAYSDFDHMMTENNPDMVCVLLQTPFHKEYVLKIADYGKHVFCEKPISLNVTDSEEMIAYCKSKGVKLFIGHVLRFFPEYLDAKSRIDAGEIGKVGVVHTKRVGPHPGKASAWYNDFEFSGGVIMDLMIHDIDFLRWTLGEVSCVYTVNFRNEDMEYALVTLQFRNKAIANLEACWGSPEAFRYGIEFAGAEGLIRFDSEDSISLKVKRHSSHSEGGGHQVAVPQTPAYNDPYYYELEHFIACIKNDLPLRITAEDACKNIEIARAAIQSATTGLPVYLQGGNA